MNAKFALNMNEFFNIQNDRYKMLFFFENAYGIFKRAEEGEESSIHYQLYQYHKHNCINVEDVFKDIVFMEKIEEIKLCTNDIVTIRINGAISSYRFLGMKNLDLEDCQKNFCEVKNFIDAEKDAYTAALKRENRILNILDGKTYLLEDLNFKNQAVCCVEKEVFDKPNPILSIISDYTIYTLKNMQIERLNPYSRPIKSIDNVLYYLNKKNANNSLIVLLDRSELEKVRDYMLLRQVAV